MKKGKRRGFELVRSDIQEESNNAKGPAGREKGELARIRTRRAMRSEDGSVISLAPQAIPVWLVQLEPISQILLADELEDKGYKPSSYKQLSEIRKEIQQAETPPRLVIVSSQAINLQVPFFRQHVLPVLEETQTRCLIVGLNERQETFWRSWYQGESTPEQEPAEVLRRVKQIIGPGLRR